MCCKMILLARGEGKFVKKKEKISALEMRSSTQAPAISWIILCLYSPLTEPLIVKRAMA